MNKNISSNTWNRIL